MRYLLVAMGCFVIVCCNTDQRSNLAVKYPYAINDFPPALHVYLWSIVNPGFIGDKNYHSIREIDTLISDKDLLRLTRAENPLLRSVALSISKRRPSIDHYNLLMNHLDDTARVSWYFQCASWEHTYVSDYMIYHYEWETQQAKTATIQKILKDHNYLATAYDALAKVKLDDSYYGIVKRMAERDEDILQRSAAIYGLASFEKEQDTAFLATVMEQNNPYLDCKCFAVLKKYKSDRFFGILKRYGRSFIRRACDVNAYYYREENVTCFLETVASYQTKESGELLRSIFNLKPFLPCSYSRDTSRLKEKFYESIMQNDCIEYRDMVAIIKPIMDERKRNELTIEGLVVEKSMDKPTIRWYGD